MFPVYDKGKHLLPEVGRGIKAYEGALPKVAPRTLRPRARAPEDRPQRQESPRARAVDLQTRGRVDRTNFGEWLDRNIKTREGLRALLDVAFTTRSGPTTRTA